MALVKVPEKTIQGLVPEHPALSAAQAALGAQLRETQRRLHDELREAITAAKAGHMEEDVLGAGFVERAEGNANSSSIHGALIYTPRSPRDNSRFRV